MAAGHRTVAEVGVEALRKGGNAVDAAVAAAFTAFVVEPTMCGLGGHGRISIHLANSGNTVGIDHFIRAPASATPDMYQRALREWVAAGHAGSEKAISTTGHLSVGIPGTVAGLCEAHRLYGTRPLRELAGPAIDLAEAGLLVDWRLSLTIANRAAEIRQYPAAAAALLPDGLPPRADTIYRPGDRLDQRDLARSIKQIVDEGPAAFYEGTLARAIEREMKENGGLVTARDLAGYSPAVFDQPRYSYRDLEYVTCGDLIGVETLNLLERFDVRGSGPDSPGYRHLMAEALGQAFVDNFAFAGDPLHVPSPLAGLASKEYAARMAKSISMDRARSEIQPGDPWAFEPSGGGEAAAPGPFAGTTSVCAADSTGNFVSLITSLGSAFGSLVLVPETGIFLGNAMQWFDPYPGKTNSVGPGRMPLYAAPVLLAFRDGQATGAIGGSGGYRIPTAVLHTFVNVVDHGLELQAAVEAPRIHTQGETLEVDAAIRAEVREALAGMGHKVNVVESTPYYGGFGVATAVWRDEAGKLHADRRAALRRHGGLLGAECRQHLGGEQFQLRQDVVRRAIGEAAQELVHACLRVGPDALDEQRGRPAQSAGRGRRGTRRRTARSQRSLAGSPIAPAPRSTRANAASSLETHRGPAPRRASRRRAWRRGAAPLRMRRRCAPAGRQAEPASAQSRRRRN